MTESLRAWETHDDKRHAVCPAEAREMLNDGEDRPTLLVEESGDKSENKSLHLL